MENSLQRLRDTSGKVNFGFWIPTHFPLGERRGDSGIISTHGTKVPNKQRRGTDDQGLSSPIPGGGQVAGVVGIQSPDEVTNGPRAMFLPQGNPSRFGGRILPDRIPRGGHDVGRFGPACAEARLRALGDVLILIGFASPRARSKLIAPGCVHLLHIGQTAVLPTGTPWLRSPAGHRSPRWVDTPPGPGFGVPPRLP